MLGPSHPRARGYIIRNGKEKAPPPRTNSRFHSFRTDSRLPSDFTRALLPARNFLSHDFSSPAILRARERRAIAIDFRKKLRDLRVLRHRCKSPRRRVSTLRLGKLRAIDRLADLSLDARVTYIARRYIGARRRSVEASPAGNETRLVTSISEIASRGHASRDTVSWRNLLDSSPGRAR